MAGRLIRWPEAATTQRTKHRVAWYSLLLLVVAAHGCVGRKLADGMLAFAFPPAPRIEVAFVRQMEVAAVPPPAARAAAPAEATAPLRPRLHRRPIPSRRPASAPEPDALSTEPASASDEERVLATAAARGPAEAASGSEGSASSAGVAASGTAVATAAGPASEAASSSASSSASGAVGGDAAAAAAGDAPVAAAEPASAAASGPLLAAFDWPVSTRVSFLLTGYYRGDVNGSAKVEWIRIGAHYQVHLDLLVGPSFAPVITRRMTSDGEITADGLAPRRYDQETRVMGMDRAPVTIRFEPGGSVLLANGSRVDGRPGLQDSASQFVQLSYVFGTRPELLRIGGTVDIPLALPHKVDVWTYDVVAEETLQTPIGALATIHLTPRRKSDRSDELTAEIWFAPQLRYLPARIRIQQGGGSYLDLLIDRRPDLAGS